MSSTFFGLQIAGSGLRAANASMNTTANNISNSDTNGYSRQTTVQEAADALRVFQTYGCAGAGVETLAVERIRDQFYDVKYRNNQTRLGEYEVKEYYCKQVEDYLTDDGKTGFSTLFTSMSAQLQEVLKNPNSATVKQNFISSMQSLTQYFNTMYANLKDVQSDINQEIKQQVDMINSYASELATISKQINTLQLSGGNLNSLLDKRDTILDELAEIVDVSTEETPIYDTTVNPPIDTGATRFVVKICGGLTLVDANTPEQLKCVARYADEKINESDVDGLYDICWADGSHFSLTNTSIGGKLEGLIQLRDGNNGTYFNGKSTAIVGNGNKTHTLTVYVDNPNLLDMSKCNLPYEGKIQVGTSEYKYSNWSFNEEAGTYSFVIDDKGTEYPIEQIKLNDKVQIGNRIEYQGIPYYLSQMNEWIRDFSKTVNSIMTSGYSSDGKAGVYLLTGNLATKNEQYSQKKLMGTDIADKTGRGYYYLTGENFAVSDAIVWDAMKLATKKGATDGVENSDLLDDFRKMLTDKTKMDFRGSSAAEFLDCILTDMALNSSNSQTFSKTYTGLQKTIGNQRVGVSGVDTDEEATNLVKFQNSYNLASKLIQTYTEIYDRLILQTGV